MIKPINTLNLFMVKAIKTPVYQPEVTQSIIDFKAGFYSCVVLLRKAYELIPDGTSHENLTEIKQVLFGNNPIINLEEKKELNEDENTI